ncbi:MAG: GAF domain-containing protein [Myxococcales bacterium]|nr:GAF domain-containing protein [Myxococcales bacterium]
MESELERLTRAYQALCACQSQIVRAASEQEMLDSVCRTLVDVGRYRMAWVGYAEHDAPRTVRPVAVAGEEAGYLSSIRVSWADDAHGHGPSGTAIRTGQPHVNRDSDKNPAFAPWREDALRRGFRSSVALPLSADGEVFGALSVYSVEPDAFDSHECSLLIRFAEDLAFGVGSLRARRSLAQRDAEAQKLVRELGERVRELTALHQGARLLLQGTGTVEDRLPELARLLPPAMEHPEHTTACISYAGHTCATEGHAPSARVLSAQFETAAGARGSVEVADHGPADQEGAFLPEERALLASLADMLRVALDRQQAVEALRSANERMNLAFEAAGMGVWEWDVAENQVRWSEHLARMVGLHGEQRGRFGEQRELIHPDDRERLYQRLERAGRGEDDLRGMEFRIVRPGGGWRQMLTSARFFPEPPARPNRVLVVLLDVSERHALEEGLRQAQKVEALGQVAAGVAHDFNNLVTVLLGAAEALREETPANAPWRPLVEDLWQASERARRLTAQLLTFSRKSKFQPAAVDVCDLLTRLEPVLTRLVGQVAELRFELDLGAGRVWADPAQIEQVVMNLVVNARDAMPEGGRLTVKTHASEVVGRSGAGAAPARYAVIEVSDTGPGIDPAIQESIFEPFFTTKGVGNGTGLGLALVSQVAREWQGFVELESSPGHGATFRVLLPRLAE